jgi:hypothetical protein
MTYSLIAEACFSALVIICPIVTHSIYIRRRPLIRPIGSRKAEPGRIVQEFIGERLEVYFGKPVVAKVRKCRTVVVKKRRGEDQDKK